MEVQSKLRILTRGLGWFSLALGGAELLSPRGVSTLSGVNRRQHHSLLVRLLGLREIAAGSGILLNKKKKPWLWSRVVGDVIDLGVLAAAFSAKRTQRQRLAIVAVAVAGITVLDGLTAANLRG